MERKDWKKILSLFRQAFDGSDFRLVEGENPCIIEYKGKVYNVFIRSLTPACLASGNEDVWRCQLPKRPIFEDFKLSNNVFLFLGYDSAYDVYATWNPFWVKQRLNVGESISLYSRYSLQQKASDDKDFVVLDLANKGGLAILFPREKLPEYIDKISSFFPVETTYVALSSSLRKGKESPANKITPDITIPELSTKIAPLMNQETPLEYEALLILSDFFGDQFKDSMTITDWLKLLRSVDWKQHQ